MSVAGACIVVMLVALAQYGINGLGGEFVQDDSAAIVGNGDLRANETTVYDIFVHDYWGTDIASEKSHKSYRPLTVLTFRWTFMIFELNSYAYKVGNVILHAIMSVQVCRLAFRYITPESTEAAATAGVLFAVHPLHSEAVLGIVGRADLLAGIFLCQGLLVDRRKALGMCLAAILFVAASLCKEIGLCGLIVASCIDLMQDASAKSWTIYLFLFVLALAGRYKICGSSFGPTFSKVDNFIHYEEHFPTRAMTYAHLHWRYLAMLMYPQNLSADWSYRSFDVVKSIGDWRNLISIVMYISALMISLCAYQNRDVWHFGKLILFGMFIGIATFVPASGVFFPVATVIAERVMYIPSVGFIFVVVGGCFQLLSRNVRRGLFLIITVVCFVRTWQRAPAWDNAISLFSAATEVVPTSTKAHLCLAVAQKNAGQVVEALASIENSLEIMPDHASAHYYKASILQDLGSNDTLAEYHYSMAVRHSLSEEFKPDVLYLALANFGAFLRHSSDPEKKRRAISHLRDALRIEPDRYAPQANLAEVFTSIGELDQALVHYKEAASHRDCSADLLNNMAIAKYKQLLRDGLAGERRELDGILQIYEKAILLDEGHAKSHLNSARLLIALKRFKKAEKHIRSCLRANPGHDH
eukprot:g429.t1